MKYITNPFKTVTREDVQRAEELLGLEGFVHDPKPPCTVRRLIRSLEPDFVQALQRIDMLRNPNKYFPHAHATRIDQFPGLSRKDQYCREHHLYDGVVDRKLADDFYGDALETGRVAESRALNSIAPGLAGYLVVYLTISSRKRSGILRQVRTLEKQDLYDYLGSWG